MAGGKTKRLAFIDNVRIFLSMLVVAHHAAQPYGSPGWWLFQSDQEPSLLIGLFICLNETFFMALFFLIAGYFHPGSVDRKGPERFVLARLWRFGVPAVVVVLGITPIFMYFHETLFEGLPTCGFWAYYSGVYLGFAPLPPGWPGAPGPHTEFIHLWFIENLFIYGCVYALYRLLAGPFDHRPEKLPETPLPTGGTHLFLALLALWLFVSTFAIRIWYHQDDWQNFFIFWEIELAHAPQYVTVFILGIVAARKNWLMRIPASVGRIWLGLALSGAVLWMAKDVGFPFPDDVGGLNFPAALRAFWESILCVGFCVGLLVLARERFPRQTPLARALSDSSFAVYVFHVPVVTLLQYALADVPLGVITKFVIVTVLGVLITFPLAHYVLRRLPVLGRAL